MGYEAKVLADSVSPAGVRLTTLEVTFPRFILAEVNTHRMLSRSSASSRAIPIEKRIKAVEEDPFVPEAFGRNRKGMQATEVLEGGEADDAHYRLGKVELIDLIERLTFNVGNAVKYLVRAGRKSESPVEDLEKAIWYAERELFRVTGKPNALKAEVESLREKLRVEEERRAQYQAVDAAARRFVEAERASLGKSSADEFALLTAAVDA